MYTNKSYNSKLCYGVSGVIEALLIIALVAIVIGIIQTVYIPEVMKQREAEHMDEVSNQFSYMKAMMDITAGSNVPVFSTVTLASSELPYFVTARSYGTLRVIDKDDAKSHINISFQTGPPVYLTSITSIKYEADNSYFVDQIYVLEGGGIFIDQPDGNSTMRVPSSVSFVNGSSVVTVRFDLPVFIGVPGKKTTEEIGGNLMKCIIRTNYSRNDPLYSVPNVNSIQIYTDYVHAWKDALKDLAKGAVNAAISSNGDYVELTSPNKTFTVEVNKIYYYVQIGPGWIR
ncbi:MAG: hypothetical protein QXS02_06470 [Candidatus Thermoplasmatota archaeon]